MSIIIFFKKGLLCSKVQILKKGQQQTHFRKKDKIDDVDEIVTANCKEKILKNTK